MESHTAVSTVSPPIDLAQLAATEQPTTCSFPIYLYMNRCNIYIYVHVCVWYIQLYMRGATVVTEEVIAGSDRKECIAVCCEWGCLASD